MSRIKALVIPLALFAALFCAAGRAFPHGGEEHGDERKSPLLSVGQSNTNLATTENFEILLKYPTPKPQEELHIQVFITDRKTNAPVSGVNTVMLFNIADKPEKPIESAALPTETPGVYQAHVVFPKTGRYNVSLKLSGENVSAQAVIKGVVVPDETAAGAAPNGSSGFPTAMAALFVLLISASIAGYLFLLRPRSRQHTQSDRESRVTGRESISV